MLAHGGHSTRPGSGRRERRCRPRRWYQPPEAPTFVGAHSQNGGVAGALSPTPPLACLRAATSWVGANLRFSRQRTLQSDFTQESPRKLLPTRAKEAHGHAAWRTSDDYIELEQLQSLHPDRHRVSERRRAGARLRTAGERFSTKATCHRALRATPGFISGHGRLGRAGGSSRR